MYTKEQIINIYKNLPKKTREILMSQELHDKCENIFQVYKITDAQSKSVEELLTDKIMGISKGNELTDKIKNGLNIPVETSIKLIEDLNTKILNNLNGLYLEILNNTKNEMLKNGVDFDVNEYLESQKDNESVDKISSSVNLNEKLGEISLKYNLDKNQEDKLNQIILSYISKPENKQILLDKLVQEVGVSDLLAEQIMADLENRIFNSVVKQAEKTEVRNNPQIPEVRPQNLPTQTSPLKQEGVLVKGSSSILDQQLEKQHVSPPAQADVPQYTLTHKPVIGFEEKKVETVQKPVPVPRLNMNTEIETKQVPQNIADDKLKNITTEPSKKYNADPYREPIQ